MSDPNIKKFELNIISTGKFDVECQRIHAPSTIDKLIQQSPIKGRGLKQGNRLVVPTSMKLRPESLKTGFHKGDLSIETSSGNLSIHLESSQLEKGENYIGKVVGDFDVELRGLSTSIIMKFIE